jgi:hypothetical protein
MKRDMGDVSYETGLTAQIAEEQLSHSRIHTLHRTTLIAYKVDVNVVIHRVVRGRTVPDVSMADQADLLKNLEIAVDR